MSHSIRQAKTKTMQAMSQASIAVSASAWEEVGCVSYLSTIDCNQFCPIQVSIVVINENIDSVHVNMCIRGNQANTPWRLFTKKY